MRATKRRQQFLRVATKLFARRGFHATTTKLIALSARCNEATLFQHFTTKENLYKAVLAAKLDECDEALQRVVDNAVLRGDDINSIASLLSDLLALHRTDSALLPLLMFSLLEHDEYAIELLQKMKSRIEQSANLNIRVEPEITQTASSSHTVISL